MEEREAGEETIDSMHLSMPGVLIANSKSQEGKSHYIKYVVHENRDKIDYVMTISKTAFDEGNLVFVPKRFKYTSWPGERSKEYPNCRTKHAVMNLIEQQLKIPKAIRPLALLVIEDEFNSLKDPLIVEIASRPTHYNIWLVIAANWINKVGTDIREGAWQVVLFRITSKKGMEAAYEAYGQDCWDVKTFAELLHRGTGNYRFLYRNLKGETKRECDWRCYKAPAVIPDFVIEPSHAREDNDFMEE